MSENIEKLIAHYTATMEKEELLVVIRRIMECMDPSDVAEAVEELDL